MDKALKYKIVVWCVIAFLLVFLPQAITNPSQVQTTAIVSGLGIDKCDGKVEVSAQIIIPQPSTSYSPKYTITSAEGENLMDAIFGVELKCGQILGLAHCYIIILGDEFCKDDILGELDYLMRSNIMGNNSALIHTSGTAKDLLKISSQLSEGDVNNLQNIAKYNKQNYSSANTNLIDIYNEYLSPASCSIIGTIDSESESSKSQNSEQSSGQNSSSNGEQQESGQESSSGQSGQSGSSSALKNDGNAIVVKNGTKLISLTKDDMIKFNWLDPNTQKGVVDIENFTNEDLKNATLSLKKISKKLSFKPKIVNNTPILEADIHLESRIESIKDENGEIYTSHKNYFSTSLTDAVSTHIKQEVLEALKKSQENNFDIWHIYNIFNESNHQAWKKYIESLEDGNYMKDLEIVLNITIENKE